MNVYFDDLKVNHMKSPVVQMSDYYAFGQAYNTHQREGSMAQNYLYNGKELQDELDLGWLDYGARMYSPEIGRWFVVDPLAEKYSNLTPYHYGANNPVRYTDPTGMDIVENNRSITYTGQDAERFVRYLQISARITLGEQLTKIVNPEGTSYGFKYIVSYNRESSVVRDVKAEGESATESKTAQQRVIPGITVKKFEGYTDQVDQGVYILLGYNDPKKRYSQYRWIQTVRTNEITSAYAKSSPFNDAPKDGTPYFWTDDQMAQWTNVDGFQTMYMDNAGRRKDSKSVYWNAELTIGGYENGVFYPIGTMTYGFQINNGRLTVTPLSTSQPSDWHIDSFTNKSKW